MGEEKVRRAQYTMSVYVPDFPGNLHSTQLNYIMANFRLPAKRHQYMVIYIFVYMSYEIHSSGLEVRNNIALMIKIHSR